MTLFRLIILSSMRGLSMRIDGEIIEEELVVSEESQNPEELLSHIAELESEVKDLKEKLYRLRGFAGSVSSSPYGGT